MMIACVDNYGYNTIMEIWAVANTAIVVSPLFFGFLGQALGMGLFGYFLLFFYVFLIIGVILNRRQFKFSSANTI